MKPMIQKKVAIFFWNFKSHFLYTSTKVSSISKKNNPSQKNWLFSQISRGSNFNVFCVSKKHSEELW